MKVVGGTYSELVLTPSHRDDCAGSGFRAAAALASIGCDLVSWTDEATSNTRKSGAAAVGFDADFRPRDRAIEFQYLTPMNPPSQVGRGAIGENIGLAAQDVVAFGLAEACEVVIEAELLVYDPQSTDDLGLARFFRASAATRVLCANGHEIKAIAEQSSIEIATRRVLEQNDLDTVVAKCGAAGSYVIERGRTGQWVGALPTATVWKLGSGDVFTAAFAYALSDGTTAIDAARTASRAAAWWVSTRMTPVPSEILRGGRIEPVAADLAPAPVSGRVYLAGPFFSVADRWLVETCFSALVDLGIEVFSPLHEVGMGGDQVAAADIAGLEGCTAVLALLDSYDPGTLFECGWARSRDIPIVGYSTVGDASNLTMVRGMGAEMHADLTSAIYRSAWTAMELP